MVSKDTRASKSLSICLTALIAAEVFGSAQADMYIEGLLAALDLLADYPRLGQAEEELGPTARRHAYRSHVVLYRTDGDADVRIQRIRHGRELPGRLQRR